MIVAYMNFFSLQNAWLNISQLLIHFLEFYGSKFDEKKVGILVNRGGCYYPFNSISECPIVIKDPLNIENNVGKNTYRISEIKTAFSEASSELEQCKHSYVRADAETLQKMEEEASAKTGNDFCSKLLFLGNIFKSEAS